MKSRRQFLTRMPFGLFGLFAAWKLRAQTPEHKKVPGAAPTFNSQPSAGPEVTNATFAQAEKLAQVSMSEAHREQAASSWRTSMAGMLERRTGPNKITLEEGLAPATLWKPELPGHAAGPAKDRFEPLAGDVAPLPAHDEDIAFAAVYQLAHWIRTRQLTSERLTRIYIARIKRFDPKLRCVITLLEQQALKQARAADREIAAGKYRGPLHGIPWGAKDLLDTAGIRTTWGAEPYRNRVPKKDATVVKRLNEAGAVLLAKLSLGALALNDIWFGGQTMNPWVPGEGAGGSSAGPGSATSAGLVAFAIGSETQGSIIDPCMRCGVNGLRPTFGRVARTGAMTLCWTMDKLGPIARSVEDTMLVLHAITGPDGEDVYSVPSHLDYDANASVKGLTVGYFPKWMHEAPATDVDRASLKTMGEMGMKLKPVSLPDWPFNSLNLLLFAEGAAAFEELTLSGKDDEMTVQSSDAWPNLFRESRFLSAVDYVQADRLRRKYAEAMAKLMSEVDLLMVPSMRGDMMVVSNMTGQPSLTLRTGFVEISKARSDWAPDSAHPVPRFDPPRRVPYGVTLIGRLFEEGVIGRVGLAMERRLKVAAERPPGY